MAKQSVQAQQAPARKPTFPTFEACPEGWFTEPVRAWFGPHWKSQIAPPVRSDEAKRLQATASREVQIANGTGWGHGTLPGTIKSAR